MSVDSKHRVNIVDFKVIPYTNKKTQAKEEMRLAQCIVTSEKMILNADGSQRMEEQVIVGELMMPKHLVDTVKGEYLAEFELAVGQDLRIGSRITKLHPYGVTAKPVPAAAAKATA